MADIILASGSRIRARILRDAGVSFEVMPSTVDETKIKTECARYGHDIRDVAMKLAEAKALDISAGAPGAYVIGADQILGLDNKSFDKPQTMDEAAARLALLSGKAHTLYSAACVVRDGKFLWQTITYPRLSMRVLTEKDITAYLADAGEDVLTSVGAYQLEGLGARLFREIDGDYFSILGLPLLPLLAFFREQNQLAF